MLDTAPFSFQEDAPPLRSQPRQPAEQASLGPQARSGPQVQAGQPHSHPLGTDTGLVTVPGASFQRQNDADDYFQRLVTASKAEDAPTGMIVMPEVYSPDLTGALTSDGSVMVTGSMKVSRELTNHGAYRDAIDSPEIDAEIEDEPEARSPHEPVRARDAVVARRATGVSITPTHEGKIRVSIWVVAAAIGVAVVGVGVILIGIASGWF